MISKVVNCVVHSRGDELLFTATPKLQDDLGNCALVANLDGYIIMPIEKYNAQIVEIIEAAKADFTKEDSEAYLLEVLKTESGDHEAIKKRLTSSARLLHAAMGISTEAGELLDMVKKHIFYGKPLDLVNLEEELGDLEWYETLLIYAMRTMNYDISRNSIRKKNVEKLRARYTQGKFTEQDAVERDLDKERAILEKKD